MAANPLPTPTLNLSTEKSATETVVRCSGRITVDTLSQLRNTAKALIHESKRVVFDFKEVSHIDSSGLGMIVGLLITARNARSELKFINLTPRVKDLFTLTRVVDALEGREDSA
jgi:anti-anti-sigma factor